MYDNSSNNKRIAKNTIFLYVRMLFVLAVNLYTSRVILRTLGVVDYGVYNVVAGFVSMFAFLNTTMSNGIQRFYNFAIGKNEENGVKKVYVTALTIQVILALLIILMIETFGMWYMNNVMVIPSERFVAAKYLFQLSLLSLLFVLIQIPYTAVIMAYERMDFYAVVGIVDVLLKLGIVLLLPVLPGDNLIAYSFLLASVSFIDFILYFGYAKKEFKELKLEFRFHKELFKSMVGFSGWNIFGTFAFMMKGQGLNMLLNAFFGPVINAARGIAAQVMSALQGFSSNILVAFRPQLVQSYAAGDYERVKKIFFSESKISYLFLCILVTPIIVEIDYILNLWLGKGYVPEYTVIFTILVLLNMLVSAFHQPMTHIIHATGKMRNFQLVNSFIVCSIVPVSWLFLKLGYSPTCVFVVSLIITSLNVIISLLLVRAVFYFGVLTYCKKVVLPCIALTLLLPMVPYAITRVMTSSIVRLFIVCALTVVMACVIVYTIALSREERRFLQNIIYRIFKR